MSQHESETIVTKQRTHLATPEQGESQLKGLQGKRSDEEARAARRVRIGQEAREVAFA
jgi:hypothetical protein